MNKLILISMFMLSTSVFSQSVFFATGKNYTDFDFKTSQDVEVEEFSNGTGNFYEVGYTTPINKKNTFRYSISINLNEYNSYGGDLATSYAWDTDYLGLNNSIELDVIKFGRKLKVSANGGFTAQTLINGQQRINGKTYDLMDSEDFNGLFANVGFGGSINYMISSKMGVAVGYNFTQAFAMTKTESSQLLNFMNQQLHFRLILSN